MKSASNNFISMVKSLKTDEIFRFSKKTIGGLINIKKAVITSEMGSITSLLKIFTNRIKSAPMPRPKIASDKIKKAKV